MKKVLVIVGLCLLVGYLIFAAFFFDNKPSNEICSRFEIITANDSVRNVIDLSDIEKLVDSKGLNPYGKQLRDVDTYKIEQAVLSNQLVKSVEVYVTNKNGIRAVVTPKTPILRVMPDNGESYYIDSDAKIMPLAKNLTVYLPIVTGAVNKDFAMKQLYGFAVFLRENNFWNAQIEQINVLQNNEIELIPRVGDQKIILGTLDNYVEKLDKLMTFYQKGLTEAGWNRYAAINLKYDKQVVCTKR